MIQPYYRKEKLDFGHSQGLKVNTPEWREAL